MSTPSTMPKTNTKPTLTKKEAELAKTIDKGLKNWEKELQRNEHLIEAMNEVENELQSSKMQVMTLGKALHTANKAFEDLSTKHVELANENEHLKEELAHCKTKIRIQQENYKVLYDKHSTINKNFVTHRHLTNVYTEGLEAKANAYYADSIFKIVWGRVVNWFGK